MHVDGFLGYPKKYTQGTFGLIYKIPQTILPKTIQKILLGIPHAVQDTPKKSRNNSQNTFGLFLVVFLLKIETSKGAAADGRRPSILSQNTMKNNQKIFRGLFLGLFFGYSVRHGASTGVFSGSFLGVIWGYLIKRPKNTLGLFFGVFLGVSKK